MLVYLFVYNYVIVEYLDFEFVIGMSVIIGEIGVGKLIMFDVFGFIFGDCVDSGVVCFGVDKVDIFVSFDVSVIVEVCDWFVECDLEQDGLCILCWVIIVEGCLCVYINGMFCLLGDLKSLGELLIDIYSQYEYQLLLKSEIYWCLFDEYVGCQELVCQVQFVV